MKIVDTIGADLNHLVLNILKSDFMIFYTNTDEQTSNAPPNNSNEGRFKRSKIFKAVDL